MSRKLFLCALFILGTVLSSCSLPICPGCKETLNINDATIVVNVCIEVQLPSGMVIPCQDAGTDSGDDGGDDSAPPDDTPE